jgi:hypothetical protein
MFDVDAFVVLELSVVKAEVPVEFTEPKLAVTEFIVPIFPVVPLKVTALLVVAFDVDAFDVMKFELVPNNVAIVPFVANKFVNVEEIAVRIFEKRLVLVELEIVALFALKLVVKIKLLFVST